MKYLVGTGIVLFAQEADSPSAAITLLKERIVEAGKRIPTFGATDIGMSLVTALREGRLNFVVMDEHRTNLLCGELNGQWEPTVSVELMDAMEELIPLGLRYAQLQKLHQARMSAARWELN